MFSLGTLISSVKTLELCIDTTWADFHPATKYVLGRQTYIWSADAEKTSVYLVVDYKSYRDEHMILAFTAQANELYLLYSFEHEEFVKCKYEQWFVKF